MSFRSLIDSFQNTRVLVVGDVMLDEYIMGSADRISPEAPVIVIKHSKTLHRPGGAANVALNILSLGGHVDLCGVIGQDADDFVDVCEQSGLRTANLVTANDRVTTRKTRVIAGTSHQVLRIDYEESRFLDDSTAKNLENRVDSLLDSCDVVLLSDYLKGTLSRTFASSLITKAKQIGKSVIVNPKPKSAEYYKDASLISLNRSEASKLIGLPINTDNVIEHAANLSKSLNSDILVTLGDKGLAGAGSQGAFQVPAVPVEVADVAGAGDTVVATIALGYRVAGLTEELLRLAAATAASVVRHVGVATVSAEDLAKLRSS